MALNHYCAYHRAPRIGPRPNTAVVKGIKGLSTALAAEEGPGVGFCRAGPAAPRFSGDVANQGIGLIWGETVVAIPILVGEGPGADARVCCGPPETWTGGQQFDPGQQPSAAQPRETIIPERTITTKAVKYAVFIIPPLCFLQSMSLNAAMRGAVFAIQELVEPWAPRLPTRFDRRLPEA